MAEQKRMALADKDRSGLCRSVVVVVVVAVVGKRYVSAPQAVYPKRWDGWLRTRNDLELLIKRELHRDVEDA